VVKGFETHENHPADPDDVAARQLVNEIKQAGVAQPERPPTQIIEARVKDASEEVLAKLPLKSAIKRSINRSRQLQLPPNPKSLRDLPSLPAEFKMSDNGEIFLLYDSYDDEEEDDDEAHASLSSQPEKIYVSVQNVVLRRYL